jgi:hypothetical protein
MVSPPKNVSHSAVWRIVTMSSIELSSDARRLTHPKYKGETQGVKASETEETKEGPERQTICCFR